MALNSHHYTGGRSQRIADLLDAGDHKVEAFGNSREGFVPQLVDELPRGDGTTFQTSIAIGPTYRTLAGLRADVCQAYGHRHKVYLSRNWH